MPGPRHFVFAAVLTGCTPAVTLQRAPIHPNPTSYIYGQPIDGVKACLERARPDSEYGLVADAWGKVVSTRYGYEPVSVVAGRFEIELSVNGVGSNEMVHSEAYLRGSCPLPLYGHWRVRATSLADDRTRVDVVPVRLEVHNYACVYVGHPWGCAIPVKSTTIEEYRILVSLGHCLGVRNMPPVSRPCGAEPDPNTCE